MYFIRPIASEDLETLHQIAIESGPGFTSLPENQQLLEAKIQRSCSAMEQAIEQAGAESYLFVLIDSDSNQVVGTTGIEAAVGLREPWYHYRMGTVVHASRELNIHNQFKTLYLCNDYTGCSEVCTLYLQPEHRHSQNGSLLSKSRFLFMAEHPQRFASRVIAEMRGYSDEEGRSPFWEGLGRKFFAMDYSEADYLTGSGNKVFIAELMPKYSIYIHLLPEEAQAVIGRVHANTEPARRMLENEGFRFENYVDIFDAGPTLTAPLEKIRAIRESRYAKVRLLNQPLSDNEPLFLISNTRTREFRCCICPIVQRQGIAEISTEAAELLQIIEGDTIRLVELKGRQL
ncbi:arginine N-succinyltransferase [Neptuniibacter halophilus]|uniref:arginine N-succinyltransferase n=1 Tax=Neptuniibacter halophilus TaxID=651666 RepID=UPI002573382D|nr:arginine N-succinyltransferase [Neptuniibacter halophilus]